MHVMCMVRTDYCYRDKAGATVCHVLARYGHVEALRRVVEMKGDESLIARTFRGASPLHYAATSGHLDMTRLIVQCLYETNQCCYYMHC